MGGEYYQIAILLICIPLYFSYACETFTIGQTFSEYQAADLTRSMIFYTVLLFIELIVVYSIMLQRCSNISLVILYPIVIWIFIFLGTKFILVVNPGFKSAFSDVIGYALTYGTEQNEALNDLLDKDTKDKDSQLISKILSDKGLLFNSIVPGNFEEIWESLKNISNSEIYNNPSTKQKFLNWVVQRDHIGEACWMVWSGILCISITSLYTYTFPCELTPSQIQQNKVDYDKIINDDIEEHENYLS